MFTRTDPDRFQKMAAGVQSWFLSMAILIGGGWTLYTFQSQLQVANARAQLARLQRDLEESPRIELYLEFNPLTVHENSGNRYFEGVLHVKNVGNKNTALLLGQDSVKVYKVNFDDKMAPDLKLFQSIDMPIDENTRIGSLIAQASSTTSVNFVFCIQEPGLYMVRVKAPRQISERNEALEAGGRATDPETGISWSALRYLAVK